jgi:hypothetical protein
LTLRIRELATERLARLLVDRAERVIDVSETGLRGLGEAGLLDERAGALGECDAVVQRGRLGGAVSGGDQVRSPVTASRTRMSPF